MYKEPKPMQEIHRIQERLFEREKNLSRSERIDRLHQEAADIIKKYGLKIKSAAKT